MAIYFPRNTGAMGLNIKPGFYRKFHIVFEEVKFLMLQPFYASDGYRVVLHFLLIFGMTWSADVSRLLFFCFPEQKITD